MYSKALALLNLKNQIGSEKNFEKALEAFDAVLKVNPEDAIAWQYRGNALRYLDRPEEAVYTAIETERSENGSEVRGRPGILNNAKKNSSLKCSGMPGVMLLMPLADTKML